MTNRNKKEYGRSSSKSDLIIALLIILIVFAVYFIGAYSYPRSLWLIELIQKLESSFNITANAANYDKFGRLTSYPKEEVTCPKQTDDTAVLLAFGQSNSANHAKEKFTTQYPAKVVNYFGGKCYVAASPLLGASGEEGEFITPLADKLIESGTYKSIVIISSGITDSPISRWQRDGDLNEMLLDVIRKVKLDYKITGIIWHQGETDFGYYTSEKNYIKSFNSLMETLRENNVTVPVFISVSTKCTPNLVWYWNNPTANAQRKLVDNKHMFLGADTDKLLADSDRRLDDCHFGRKGQLKTADSFAAAIKRTR
jgi:hypothetical protein